ncbi:hypothetical protein [Actinomadura sp. 9N215]|uniref:hypothetical protein n=1 Tax=Actinomadura sp. 9N215 TaxID=3375150 RepID=UPI0037BB2A25
MDDLLARLAHVAPDAFPYEAVLDEYRRVGKHFVHKDLLCALDATRTRIFGRSTADASELKRFLNCALDKWDGHYDYATYIGLSLLPMPDVESPSEALARRDRLVLLLVTDALRFELDAADGRTGLLPRFRPDERSVAKRCRLGVRAVGQDTWVVRPRGREFVDDPMKVSRRLCEGLAARATSAERRFLELSMLPVYTVHDEYLFIRVLQAFEVTFAATCVLLRATINALLNGAGEIAAERLGSAEAVLRGSAPLFSFLATMRVASFHTFRQFTEGASAIQSDYYKMMEALCRTPDPERLNSPAYRSVPEVRRLVGEGVANVDEVFYAARAAGVLAPSAASEVASAMDRFATTLKLWRRTHYRLAVRMLGERRGTGYTEGTPYLKQALDVPVFLDTRDRSRGR